MAKEKPDLGRVTLVYVGAFITTKGTLAHRYCEVVDGKHKEPPMAWTKPLMGKWAEPGAMYDFDIAKVDEKGEFVSVFPNSRRYLGMYEDEKVVATWQVAHRSQKDQHQAERDEKKDASKRYDLKALEPWRLAYTQARGIRKTLILMRAIMYISKGK